MSRVRSAKKCRMARRMILAAIRQECAALLKIQMFAPGLWGRRPYKMKNDDRRDFFLLSRNLDLSGLLSWPLLECAPGASRQCAQWQQQSGRGDSRAR
jgi:hypothetical protein